VSEEFPGKIKRRKREKASAAKSDQKRLEINLIFGEAPSLTVESERASDLGTN
jgi:hypothetical protein